MTGSSRTPLSNSDSETSQQKGNGSHHEQPRTSHETSDPEEDRYSFVSRNNPSKSKPLPPSHKHGRLIRMELRDDASPLASPRSPMNPLSQPQLNNSGSTLSLRSQTDLNKPLPPAPRRASHGSDNDEHESIFDREAAGKVPELPSPTTSIRKQYAPAPPVTRRHSQLVAASKLTRNETGRLSPNLEEQGSSIIKTKDLEIRPQSSSNKPPPPPPSRRPGSIRTTSYSQQFVSASQDLSRSNSMDKSNVRSGGAPPPPPTRSSSTRQALKPSSASIHSMESKRSPAQPPPPPPPRQRASSRNSMEAPVLSPVTGRASGEYFRESIDSGRRGSVTSQSSSVVIRETERRDSGAAANSILADLSALQREVDAIRAAQEKRGAS